MATINEIKQQAAAVKNATQVGENTAERVGGALAGLAEIAEQHDSKLSDLCDTFDGVVGKDATPKDGKFFYIGYESGVYPNFDNLECYLNGINILKRMPNGKFGNYFVGLD